MTSARRKEEEHDRGEKGHKEETVWPLRPTPGLISGQAYSRTRTRICFPWGPTDWHCYFAFQGYKFKYIKYVCWENVPLIRTEDYLESIPLALPFLTSLWTLISPMWPCHSQATDSRIALPSEPSTPQIHTAMKDHFLISRAISSLVIRPPPSHQHPKKGGQGESKISEIISSPFSWVEGSMR